LKEPRLQTFRRLPAEVLLLSVAARKHSPGSLLKPRLESFTPARPLALFDSSAFAISFNPKPDKIKVPARRR
jgi:hypothetical protein